jgi:hypothetical protein
MISEIKQAIIDKLRELYPQAHIYEGTLPADYQRSAFLAVITEASYAKGLGGRFNASVTFDLAYYPAHTEQAHRESYQISEEVCRALSLLKAYSISRITAKLEEALLHIRFTVPYSEIKTQTEIKMKELEMNEGGY